MTIKWATAGLVLAGFFNAFGANPEFSQGLTLVKALELSLARHPSLRAANLEVQATEGMGRQARTLPNPTLTAEVEDFGGSGEQQGFDAAQTTVSLEQTIEWSGKRTGRRNAATAEAKRAERERTARRLDVIQETREHFVDVLAAQAEWALEQETRRTAESIHQTVSRRVSAGKDSPVEEAKARAELARAKLSEERAHSRRVVARRALCALWGEDTPSFEAVLGNLSDLGPAVPELEGLAESMVLSPEWARGTDEIQAAEWAVQAERHSRIPDLTLGAGIRQSQADGQQSYVAMIGVDLPIFDRNAGRLQAAQADLERSRMEQEAAQTALRVELATASEQLTTLRKAALSMVQDALPAAEQAFAAAQAAYASGKIGYLDIQDARRSLVETRRQQIETLAEYHRAAALVERLAGIPLIKIL